MQGCGKGRGKAQERVMKVTRRDLLRTGAAGLAGMAVPGALGSAAGKDGSGGQEEKTGFRYCLNASTLRGQKMGLRGFLEVASGAGYDGVELWLREIEEYLGSGGTRQELRGMLDDLGLVFEDVIAFAPWIVEEEGKRREALETMRRDLDLLAELGCRRMAAPPAGATQGERLDLRRVAERYRAVLELAEGTGVRPVLEVWGFAANLSRLGEAVQVLVEADHAEATLLPDVYHLHRGGSGFGGLRFLSAEAVGMFHLNDYPGGREAASLTDADRVYPGEGVAPWEQIRRDLRRINPQMVLSLELFNPTYWARDHGVVAAEGLAAMRKVMA